MFFSAARGERAGALASVHGTCRISDHAASSTSELCHCLSLCRDAAAALTSSSSPTRSDQGSVPRKRAGPQCTRSSASSGQLAS